MDGIWIMLGLIVICLLLVWVLTSSDTLDDILRERADYDVWLRRNQISEQKERELEKQKDDLEHKGKMNELKNEVDKLEKMLKGK